MENVDAALNEVRPPAADGGDVEVVGIEDGIVAVRMFGARHLQQLHCDAERRDRDDAVQSFGRDAIKEVVNLDQGGREGKGR